MVKYQILLLIQLLVRSAESFPTDFSRESSRIPDAQAENNFNVSQIVNRVTELTFI